MSSINYDLSKIRAFAFDVDGVLSPSTIPMSPEGEPLRMVNIKDGYAIQLAVKMGYHVAIISGARTQAVVVRFRGLGVEDVFTGVAIKLPCLTNWMDKHGLNPDEVVFGGDDIPDLEAMAYVGLAAAPADAATEARQAAAYISPYNGGYGFGRDIIEQVMRAQGKWMADKRAFGW